jgi:crotonobetainyl-CoA:carnitine CoA-transferase CaiB-like acyl-CoA transferase
LGKLALYRVPGHGERMTTPADFIDRMLPYGIWVCEDGREVLFSRMYTPLWQRYRGQLPTRADLSETVPWVTQEWFYSDRHNAEQRRERALLAAWRWRIVGEVVTYAQELEQQLKAPKDASHIRRL